LIVSFLRNTALIRSVLLIFLVFVLPYFVLLRSELRVVRFVTNFTYKRWSVRLYLQLIVEGLMSYLLYLCLLAHIGVKHILCCVFVFFVLCRVYHVLPVSLDCPFLIAPSIFSNVYLHSNISLLCAAKRLLCHKANG
jgi:hypothetical protein